MKAEDIREMGNSYNPWDYYHHNPLIKRVMDAIGSDMFCPGESGFFEPILKKTLHEGDYYYHLADLQPYTDTQKIVSEDYCNPSIWARKAILNVARTGKFSSDRTISEYAKDIWGISPVV